MFFSYFSYKRMLFNFGFLSVLGFRLIPIMDFFTPYILRNDRLPIYASIYTIHFECSIIATLFIQIINCKGRPTKCT